MTSHNSFDALDSLSTDGRSYSYYSLRRATKNGLTDPSSLPVSIKIVLENLLRFEDSHSVTPDDIDSCARWSRDRGTQRQEIAYRPARVLMQDFTGVPAVVDLAAMRDAAARTGNDPLRINPQIPVDLVIDHSVMVDHFGHGDAFSLNVEREYQRNRERYEFLKWSRNAFTNLRVVPPGTGICHQVNLEYLARTVWTDGNLAYPDTCIGTDSHTTMINALSVLGWGVGGIEAEAAMLGQPVSMLLPEVVGVRLNGTLDDGVTATDLVLTIVEALRKRDVVGKFVEFHGDGLDSLSLEDRSTIANMAPEYGATCGFFPIDAETLAYLRTTGRDQQQIALVETYAREQGLWRSDTAPVFSDTLDVELSSISPCIAGPRRPQDRVPLDRAAFEFDRYLSGQAKTTPTESDSRKPVRSGDVVLAAITSCTNTSNPSVLIAAGLLARNARQRGMKVKPWVKTSLAPGSQVVTDYLDKAGLTEHLDALGFHLVGYGCTTCIGNSGPLPDHIAQAITRDNLVVAGVLSGNRNFEGRVNPLVRAGYLASPPLVVAYALAGSMRVDLTRDALGTDAVGQPVHLADIWPAADQIRSLVRSSLDTEMFARRYGSVFDGDQQWQNIQTRDDPAYRWPEQSSYVCKPPYFEMQHDMGDIENAAILGLFGESVTTDHISPAGNIAPDSPAGKYLLERGVSKNNFNSYGSRRGNHQVMMRGTFANIRIRNLMLDDTEGGYTRHAQTGQIMTIYDAAMSYQGRQTPLVVCARGQYGTGSSRDWAAKGTRLLGVRAVIAESFERIHRANLVGMGVMPLQFMQGENWPGLGLTGSETVSIRGLSELEPRGRIAAEIVYPDGRACMVSLLVRIDTAAEMSCFRSGGILPYVMEQLDSPDVSDGQM